MPVVERGDFALYETQAILRWIDRLYPDPALTPGDLEQAARMDQLMNITDWYLMPQAGAPIVFPRVVAPRLGIPPDESRIAENLPKAKVCVDEIARLLGSQAFLAGEALSLADLMLAPHISMLAQCGEGQELLKPHGALKAWLARMEARPSMKATTWDRLLEIDQAA
jgi:glutathione S-transferase